MVQVREERRKMRIDSVRRKIIENWKDGKDTAYEQLLSWCMVNFGTARRTAKEYVDAIVNYGNEIVMDGKIIHYNKQLPPMEEQILGDAKDGPTSS